MRLGHFVEYFEVVFKCKLWTTKAWGEHAHVFLLEDKKIYMYNLLVWECLAARMGLLDLGKSSLCNSVLIYLLAWICSHTWCCFFKDHSPPTNEARVRFPDSASYVGWVCWFSTQHREVFSGYSGFPSPQKPAFDLINFHCSFQFTVSPISAPSARTTRHLNFLSFPFLE